MRNNLTALVFVIVAIPTAFVFNSNVQRKSPINEDILKNKDSIKADLLKVLNQEFTLWYPLVIDKEYGGYYSDVNYKWELEGRQDKMIVTQARHVWSNANAAQYFNDKTQYLKVAEHGYKFLRDVMWDKKYGGFYNLVNRKGEPIKDRKGQIIKQAYGNAFAIYGLSAYYKVSQDTSVLNLAKRTFEWFEEHSYDAKYGGYFQFVSREGKPFTEGFQGTPPKDQNSSIHIMEAFAELFKVWPNELLKERLTALMHLIRDTITTNKGYMHLFFKRDWTPISYRDSSAAVQKKKFEFDHVSFGHDIETGYLLLEASHVLGIQNDKTTLRKSKLMVDHSLENGFDNKNGGIFDGGYYYAGKKDITIVKKTKEWWSQIEALNSCLLMSQLFPEDPHNYYEHFLIQWNYIKKYLLDSRFGGWYRYGMDTAPWVINTPKADIWKCNYHTSRGLINCLKRLDGAAEY